MFSLTLKAVLIHITGPKLQAHWRVKTSSTFKDQCVILIGGPILYSHWMADATSI